MATGYSGTPLPAKLGITGDTRLLVVGPAPELDLGSPAVSHRRRGQNPYDVILLFCPDGAGLTSRFGGLTTALTTAGCLWACWPKKSSGMLSDLDEHGVREHGLAAGLVDVKIAAIDQTWSGLKFVRRLADR